LLWRLLLSRRLGLLLRRPLGWRLNSSRRRLIRALHHYFRRLPSTRRRLIRALHHHFGLLRSRLKRRLFGNLIPTFVALYVSRLLLRLCSSRCFHLTGARSPWPMFLIELPVNFTV